MVNLRAEIESKLNVLNQELNNVTTEVELSRQADQEEDVAVTRDLLDKKSMITQQISNLQTDLDNFRENNSSVTDIGSTIRLKANGVIKEITIVPSAQADPSRGYISAASPLGMVLIGKVKGDSILFETPAGKQIYEVLEIK